MFKSGVAGITQANLAALSRLSFIDKYYLAGGTALALHLGHRLSYDLDFFSQTPEKPELIIQELDSLGKVEIVQNDEGTFNGVLNEGKVSFFRYPYPLLGEPVVFEGIKIAKLEDIVCMKLEVVGSRGSKRDFIDLYFLLQQYGLEAALDLFRRKYQRKDISTAHIIKSLCYFEDAEAEVMPEMLNQLDWVEVKNFFVELVRDYTKKIGLVR